MVSSKNKYLLPFFLAGGILLSKTLMSEDTCISLLAMASPQTIQKMGGDHKTCKIIRASVDKFNQAIKTSEIPGELVLKHFGEVDFLTDPTPKLDIINCFNPRSAINNLQDQFSADLVLVLVDDPTSCAYSGNRISRDQAIIVMHYECLMWNTYSLSRQIGYLLGAGNNIDQSGTFNGDTNCALSAQPFNIYDLSDNVGATISTTIMGYTDNDVFVPFDSSEVKMRPFFSYISNKQGNEATGDREHNNASIMKTNFCGLANNFSTSRNSITDGIHITDGCYSEETDNSFTQGSQFTGPAQVGVSARKRVRVKDSRIAPSQGGKAQFGTRTREEPPD
ncbi:MAG: hypothetical protein CMI36_10220 [Owenweeksia sp.]|nr:hypothetical protein [Owenweeksia sp.]MBF99359.1 hypothetical protein [Owenweeksia sp.]HBF22071.1 hypothetical protein [Cryomorphaceae bacterium]|tara:strand:- start:4682 stop:5689 length:1008 start_codon:yes stop_codon:yes gene_type:complete